MAKADLAGLDSFDPGERRRALAEARRLDYPAAGGNVNMHLHSFHSYNALGWSPARLAVEARRAGLYAAAVCDFDVLDGMEEFLEAGLLLGLRTAVHLETRVYLAEMARVDINSPGEHGVAYMMGAGFVRLPSAGSPEARTLEGFRAQARRRNEELVARINAAVPEIAIDYERDVLPLTPGGNATERHIIRAYSMRLRTVFEDPKAQAAFLEDSLGVGADQAALSTSDDPALEEQLRSRLVKRGGLGYQAPTERSFPAAEAFIDWVRSCRAIPMYAFLDGTSAGEADVTKLLELLAAKGVAAVNIIPDRNWNLRRADEAAAKRALLAEFVSAADRMGLPINIGTEMNRLGQPFFDDLAGEALAPHAESFRRGARIMVGHSILLRYADLSWTDERALAECGSALERARLFEQVGALPPLTETAARRLEAMGVERALGHIRDCAAAGRWLP